MSKVTISLNGEDYQIEENASISQLIEDLDLDLEKIAIERNLQIVAPESFEKTKITAGDNLEIVSFIGGG